MRRLAAAVVVGIALGGAIYLGSQRLGSTDYSCPGGNMGVFGPRCDGVRWRALWHTFPNGQRVQFIDTAFSYPRSRADWQSPLSILIGVLGIAGGLVVLQTRPKQPLGNSPQTA